MNKPNTNVVLTGDRPTGRLHLGHYVGSLKNRVLLQDRPDIAERFYMVADVQALTDNFNTPQRVRDNVYEVVLDNLAVGLNPEKTHIFIQSMIPEIAELTVFFLNLVTVNRLFQNPTVKSEIEQKFIRHLNIDDAKKITQSPRVLELLRSIAKRFNAKRVNLNLEIKKQAVIPAGFLCYPVSQAADILFARANLVPVGEDQRPMIEQTNEIGAAFNRIYGTDIFPHVDILVGEIPRLVGIDGNAKMSKSLGNTIYLADEPTEIERKVRSMFTCPSKIRVSDMVSDAELARNVVFMYLDLFDPNPSEIAEMKREYQDGRMGDMPGKERLISVLRTILDPIREQRKMWEADISRVRRIIAEGTDYARTRAQDTMNEVRRSMRIDY